MTKSNDQKKDKTWLCPHCGRTADDPHDFSDVSCAMNAVQCYTESFVKRDDGTVKEVKEDGVVEPQPEWYKDEEKND